MSHDSPGQPSHDPLAFLAAAGEMGDRIRAFDWSATPVGPPAGWPQSLRTGVQIILNSRYPMFIWWGRALTNFYNDAYIPVLGRRHPAALGRPAAEVWADIWPVVGPQAELVLNQGRATWNAESLLVMERHGFKEETYFTFSYSPLLDGGGPGGVFCACTEDTARTIGGRRLRTLRELAARTPEEARSAEEACRSAARTLAANPHDVPFALIYLLDDSTARLAGSAGLPDGSPAAPPAVLLTDPVGAGGWPLRPALESGRPEVVTDLAARFGPLPGAAWPEPPREAVVLPMARPGQARPAGFVVAGVSPRRKLDDDYRGFFDLLAGHVAAAVANARAYEEERKRAEALAELDRAKTAFFSNVSHEFRTPLTLMLGPVEDLLARGHAELSPAARDQLEVVNRNGLRLLRLVNTLLDFSRIEAGRVRAAFQPTDLSAFTAELAGVFRAAAEAAGLSLVVDCPPLGEPVYVDHDMWEKVVLNLLSNAFKFTFDGEIAVSLRRAGDAAELTVRDTGTGIPAEEMPRLFERFHRVENARGRTHEGSGIGLALVQELVKLHGGTVTAASVVGEGTAFTVTVPLGAAHLPPDQLGGGRSRASTATGAIPFVEEALRWLPDATRRGAEPVPELPPYPEALPVPAPVPTTGGQDDRPRVLVADDNADMRHYVSRLLAEHYRVETVSDGEAALRAARKRPPDLILSDVMMPRLDGFALLRELRAIPRTRDVPVILLSARAGEESRVEGMQAGADDYLVKPFGSRELLARVSAHLRIAHMRREANETLRRSEERLRMALTASRMVAWEFDPATGKVVASDNVREVYGLPPGGAIEHERQGFALVHPDDVERHRATVDRAVAECGGYQSQFRVLRPDTGAVMWMEERGQAVREGPSGALRLIGVAMDVTERLRAEQAVRRAEERYRLIVESATDFAIITLDGAGLVTGWNSGARNLLGHDDAEIVGRDGRFMFTPEDVERGVPEREMQIALTQGRATNERWHVRKDGSRFWGSGLMMPLRDEGAVVGFLKIMRDTTEARQSRELVERQAEALRQADRRKDEFLATLAHELRNPLAPLRNGLQIMRVAARNPEAVEQARAMMDRQLAQMVRLIDDLLDLSRVSRGKIELRRERVELSAVIGAAVETSRPLLDSAGVALSVELPPEPLALDGDPTRLAQVFSNLLNNAAKFTDRGGRVRLTATGEDGQAAVRVRDDGIGIPAEALPRLFEMFSQADRSLERSRGGLGIGLSLVKGLTELHGGSVAVHSDGPGRGSEFTVRLPLAGTAAPRAARAPEGGPAGRAPGRRILIVDDNRDAAESLQMILSIQGHETRTAGDGVEAVEAAEAFRPQVMLLDIGLPLLNGYDVCRRVRGQPWGRDVVIVATTGWGQEEDRRRSEEAGFDHHMVKPVDPAALERLLAAPPGSPRRGPT